MAIRQLEVGGGAGGERAQREDDSADKDDGTAPTLSTTS